MKVSERVIVREREGGRVMESERWRTREHHVCTAYLRDLVLEQPSREDSNPWNVCVCEGGSVRKHSRNNQWR